MQLSRVPTRRTCFFPKTIMSLWSAAVPLYLEGIPLSSASLSTVWPSPIGFSVTSSSSLEEFMMVTINFVRQGENTEKDRMINPGDSRE